MEYLQNLLDVTNIPFLSAFLLGLMTAISPCPLATNITAIGFISKDLEDRKKIFFNGLWYTLGRAISYTALGVILYFGASKFHVSKIFQANGEKFLGPLLIIVGILMLDIIKIKFPGLGKLTSGMENKEKKDNWWSALLLGIIFALAFCPYSGVLYFGMLIPMTISSTSGLFLPFIFAVATGLPVIIVAYLLAFSLSSVGGFYNKVKIFEKWFRKIIAVVFILVGLYFVYTFFIS
ncbi:MAG TPA: cytochrome C biogenesis protein [Bacteroidales bacterium]|nr:MAG: cytochrome C biogenesis protein [Bacteroidetes bacterium GWF2_33_38]OFY69471.1 MAG: cytochrome C biogenesis protein [Bacteroidetes bacterium RIFOXYA12_FULL_33_9]OFY90470.1 MAG: cytochrome C biogenesis protein [Bacteroidetes bacterium RIFOXYA2_FULL_33_7]HBF87698.1 cytochrome C biogenesis protein [Bacteroidales bacterium]